VAGKETSTQQGTWKKREGGRELGWRNGGGKERQKASFAVLEKSLKRKLGGLRKGKALKTEQDTEKVENGALRACKSLTSLVEKSVPKHRTQRRSEGAAIDRRKKQELGHNKRKGGGGWAVRGGNAFTIVRLSC